MMASRLCRQSCPYTYPDSPAFLAPSSLHARQREDQPVEQQETAPFPIARHAVENNLDKASQFSDWYGRWSPSVSIW